MHSYHRTITRKEYFCFLTRKSCLDTATLVVLLRAKLSQSYNPNRQSPLSHSVSLVSHLISSLISGRPMHLPPSLCMILTCIFLYLCTMYNFFCTCLFIHIAVDFFLSFVFHIPVIDIFVPLFTYPCLIHISLLLMWLSNE
jgi:hypothetical protein